MDRPETYFGGKAEGIVAGLDVMDKKNKNKKSGFVYCLFVLAGTSVWCKYEKEKVCHKMEMGNRGIRVLS